MGARSRIEKGIIGLLPRSADENGRWLRPAYGRDDAARGRSRRGSLRDGHLGPAAAQLHHDLDALAAAVHGEEALAVEADGPLGLLQRELLGRPPIQLDEH